MRRIDNLRLLATSHPFGDHHRLGVHVLEPVSRHRLNGPPDRSGEILRATQSRAKRIRELGEAPPCEVVRRCGLDQLVCIGLQRCRNGVRALGFEGDGNRYGAGQRNQVGQRQPHADLL